MQLSCAHYLFLPPTRLHTWLPPARLGSVNDVVMDQTGRVNHFGDHRNMSLRFRNVTASKQEEHMIIAQKVCPSVKRREMPRLAVIGLSLFACAGLTKQPLLSKTDLTDLLLRKAVTFCKAQFHFFFFQSKFVAFSCVVVWS